MAKTESKVTTARSPAKQSKPPSRSTQAASSADATVPASLIAALPSAAPMMAAMREFASHYKSLEKELAKAEKGGAIQMARAYVVLYKMVERVDELLKPLVSEKEETPGLFTLYKKFKVPAVFEQEGVPNVPLAEGYRVQLSERYFASIKKGMQMDAFKWLQANGLSDLIKTTVNSSALSSAFSELREEKNIEPPADVFNVAMVPGTSVVNIKK